MNIDTTFLRGTTPRIAVLLAAYNGEKWIEEQIETILNQKKVSVDLYISLDLSTDNSLKIINYFSSQHHNIKLLPYGERFGGAAPNFYNLLLNVPISNYDYFALSDQDDIWFPDKLIKAIELMHREVSSGYSSSVTAFWENGRSKNINKSYSQCEYDYLFESPGPGCSFVLKKELICSLQNHLRIYPSIDKLDWHDWIIYAFARKNKYKWSIDKHSYILYRQHMNNQLGVNSGCFAFLKRVKDIFSGYGINQSIQLIHFLNMEKNSFVKNWYRNGKVNYFKLAFRSRKCRRKILDKALFFFACIVMCVTQPEIIMIGTPIKD